MSTTDLSYRRPDRLAELEIPEFDLLTPAQETRLGKRIRHGLSRLRDLLLAHPAGAKKWLDLMSRYVERRDAVRSWAGRRATVEREYKTLARAWTAATRAAPRDPATARRKLASVSRALRAYDVMPEQMVRWAGEVLGGEPDVAGLAVTRDLPRLERVLRRVFSRLIQDRDEVTLANVRLVLSDALRVSNRGIRKSDLFQEGVIGIQKAALRFDPDRGVKFSTYATFWVRQSIRNALKEKARIIRIPHAVQEDVQRFFAGRESRLDDDEVRSLAPVFRSPAALAAPRPGSSDGEARELSLVAAVPASEELHTQTIPDAVDRALQSLPRREQLVLRRRFGVDGGPKESLEKIGTRLRLSRERVRQIEREALEMLAEHQDLSEVYTDLVAEGAA